MNENGNPEEPVKFYCELGELRKRYMYNLFQSQFKDNDV